jgi:hypothetical protein
MKKSLFYTFIVIALFSCSEKGGADFNASNFVAVDSDTSFSTFSKEKDEFLIDNQFYKSHQYEDELRNTIQFVLKVNEKEWYTNESSIKQISFTPISSNLTLNNWNIEAGADNYNFTKNLLSLEYFPKEDSHFDNTYQFYDLKSGNLLLSFTYGMMQVNFSDLFSKRFLGFLARGSRNPDIDKFTKSETLGYFTYASQEKILSTIEIRAKNKATFDAFHKTAPVLEFEVDTVNQKYQKLSEKSLYYSSIENPTKQTKEIEFSVKATFYKGKSYEAFEIIIPIKEDKIDTKGIIYDKEQFEMIFP